jgi:hypothetical protein
LLLAFCASGLYSSLYSLDAAAELIDLFHSSLMAPFFPKSHQMELNRLTKTRDDLCGIQQYYTQSLGPGKYTTTNLVPDAKQVNPLASEQQLLYPREGYGLNNASVDADSMLRNESSFKSNRCQVRAQARPS